MNLNAKLSVGQLNQEVTVSASQGLLNTATASGGGTLDNTKVQNMPSMGLYVFYDLAFVQGVLSTGTNEFNTTPRNATTPAFSVSGSPTSANTYFVNGAPVSTTANPDFVTSQDATEEVHASVNSYDAAEGPGAGGVFSTIVKSGTNSYHGDLYNYYGNEVLNANTWAANETGLARSADTRNTYGGTLGGPVFKNKTFFFGSFETFEQNQPGPAVDSVPTAAMRAGNFAGSGYTIYDPSTVTCTKTSASGCSTYGRTQYPNNVIPASQISPIGQAILNLYPAPSLPGSLNNYAITKDAKYGYRQYLARVDQYFSEKNRLSILFTEQGDTEFLGQNGISNAGSTQQTQTGYDVNAVVDFTRTISPSLVADLRMSFSRRTAVTTTGLEVQQDYSIPGLDMPFVPTTTKQNVSPSFTVTNYTALGGNTSNGTVNNYWYLSPSLAQVKGRHTLHYGFEFMNIQSGASGIPGTPNGAFTFGLNWTQQNPLTASTGSGNALADMLLGYPSSGSVDWNSNPLISYRYYATSVQDDFKLSPKITLNFGMRWDVDTSPSERHNGINGPFCFACPNPYSSQVKSLGPLTGGLTFAGVSAPRAPYNVKLSNWQPRVGIACAITPKTVFRAGFGMFSNYGNLGTTSTGFSETTSYLESANGNVNPVNSFLSGHPYPNGVIAPAGAQGGLATNAGSAISYYSSSGAIPWTEHWSIGFQRELPKQLLLDVEYVGSHSHGILVSQPWDVITTAQQQACFANNAVCTNAVPNPFYGVLPATANLGSSATLQAYQLTRPNPLFNGVSQTNDPAGYSIYNALQVRVERKIKSLDFVVSYSYTNEMSATAYQNSGNFRDATLWYGPDSGLDIRHVVTANAVWPLPIGQGGLVLKDAKGFLGALVNHWQLDPTIEARSGLPLSVNAANLTGAPGCTSYAPQGGQTRAHWFNNAESCYQPLNTWQARTSPLYISYLTNPGYWVFIAAVQKTFALPYKEMSATLRVECLNCTNSYSNGIPSTTLTSLPTFSPTTGWSGFGTITTDLQQNRQALISLKIRF